MYDFTKASDLAKWAQEQYSNANRYKSGGIGRYDVDGTRQFDCCGLFKCFMWHDYSTSNAKYYGKKQKDLNCEGLLAEAKEKGTIDTIPEIPGVLVYQKGHMGIYIGNGMVIESTAKKYDGVHGKIYKTYFKGNGAGCNGKRTTWTHWFKSPYLEYIASTEAITKITIPNGKGCFKKGDKGDSIEKIDEWLYQRYNDPKIKGNYFGPYTEKYVKRFQEEARVNGTYTGKNATIDGKVGPLTLNAMRLAGFKY